MTNARRLRFFHGVLVGTLAVCLLDAVVRSIKTSRSRPLLNVTSASDGMYLEGSGSDLTDDLKGVRNPVTSNFRHAWYRRRNLWLVVLAGISTLVYIYYALLSKSYSERATYLFFGSVIGMALSITIVVVRVLRVLLTALFNKYITTPAKRLAVGLSGGFVLFVVASAQQIQFAESPYQRTHPGVGIDSYRKALFFAASHAINTDGGNVLYYAWTTQLMVLLLPVVGLLTLGTLAALYTTMTFRNNGLSGADN